MKEERIKYLFECFLRDEISDEQKQELSAYILKDENDPVMAGLMEAYWSKLLATEDISADKAAVIFERIIGDSAKESARNAGGGIMLPWLRLAAAAMVLFAVGIGAYKYLGQSGKQQKNAGVTKLVVPDQDILAPETNKARLTTAAGHTIILDTAQLGILTGEAQKISDGSIAYGGGDAVVELHTLTVPFGSKPVQLKLPDNTQVWLNVGSSITFPTAFPGDERKVTLSGEAYLEVAKVSGKKFMVYTERSQTEVLGTHFNVSSYSNETATKITLLEGRVQVSEIQGKDIKVLAPGQQAQVPNQAFGKGISKLNNINVEEVMAWKNGVFQFEQADIKFIMRQIERWYNVDVVFEKDISAKFVGTIPRNVNVSKLLSMLEMTGHVHFKINGRTITVMP